MCSSLTHCCEAWTLNRTVIRSINGFNSRRLHVITGEHYRETATAPAYALVLFFFQSSIDNIPHRASCLTLVQVTLASRRSAVDDTNVRSSADTIRLSYTLTTGMVAGERPCTSSVEDTISAAPRPPRGRHITIPTTYRTWADISRNYTGIIIVDELRTTRRLTSKK